VFYPIISKVAATFTTRYHQNVYKWKEGYQPPYPNRVMQVEGTIKQLQIVQLKAKKLTLLISRTDIRLEIFLFESIEKWRRIWSLELTKYFDEPILHACWNEALELKVFHILTKSGKLWSWSSESST
jgi:hypothetical protein